MSHIVNEDPLALLAGGGFVDDDAVNLLEQMAIWNVMIVITVDIWLQSLTDDILCFLRDGLSSCTECTDSRFPCTWCVRNNICTNNREVCSSDALITGRHVSEMDIIAIIVVLILFFLPWVLLSVLWRCWLGVRKGIRPVKNWVVGCWRGCLHGVQTCI